MSNTNMLNVVRTIIDDYLKHIEIADTVAGEIVSVNPLNVRIDENLVLTSEFLYTTYPIPPGALNQSVQLQKQVGGQKFHILPKQFWR
jgi:hypothetical protein